jgi:RNA methyltransferase, TrmH family
MGQAAGSEHPEVRSITSAQNPAVRAARRLARRGPTADGEFLVEGPQSVRAAAAGDTRGRLTRLFLTAAAAREDRALVDHALAAGVDVVLVPAAVLAELATTVTPQGVVGVGALPALAPAEVLRAAGFAVVLVDARDPGNVGTVLRTADAAGVQAVVLAGTCVDPRNAKAVRASAGSLFHVPVAREPDAGAAIAACRGAGLRVVGTAAGATTRHTEADLAAPTALLFGSEAHGLPREALAACDEIVAVPIYGRAESLNLAATVAVVAYEAARQRQEAVTAA